VATGIRVFDRFGSVDGFLLAAGVSYNAFFALIPLLLFVTGVAGLVLTDAASRAALVESLASIFPPISGIVEDILNGIAESSPSASIIGLVLAGWGTSRLFASLESAISQLDTGEPRRGFVRTTARRAASVAVVGGILILALLAAPVLSFLEDRAGEGTTVSALLGLLLAVVPPILAAVALLVVYRMVPLVRPSWRAVLVPGILGGLALVALTRVFTFIAPRLLAGNVIYGTIGTILVGLTWLDFVFIVILFGAAWVVERRALEAARG
jgi:membrane protein